MKKTPAKKREAPAPADLMILRPGGEGAGERVAESEETKIDAMTGEELDVYVAQQKALLKRLETAAKRTLTLRQETPPGPRYYAISWLSRGRPEDREREEGKLLDGRAIKELTDEELDAIIQQGEEENRQRTGSPDGQIRTLRLSEMNYDELLHFGRINGYEIPEDGKGQEADPAGETGS